MSYTNKVYHFWNGKNIDGKPYMKEPEIIRKATQISGDSLIKCQIGVDTFSTNDLQDGVEYE